MKLVAFVLIIFSANSYADIYKCVQDNRQIYSQEPCGNDAAVVKFENQAKPKEYEHHALNSKSTKIITGKVIRVTDGDTITMQTYAGKEKIRFAQIDAPETSHFGSKSQPYGKEAGQYLRKLVMNQTARVEVETIDQYGRNVGTVYVNGTNINFELVKNGFAWVYRQYAHDATLIDLEKTARAKHIGLWSLDNPIYPPDFRKANK
jgi:endonuclease YncB( thermonuclease family)